MFDNLRELTDHPEGNKAQPVTFPTEEYVEKTPGTGRMMGMTAGQRLLISILLFFTVVILSAACLLVTERILLT
jgi:hypothetical protein